MGGEGSFSTTALSDVGLTLAERGAEETSGNEVTRERDNSQKAIPQLPQLPDTTLKISLHQQGQTLSGSRLLDRRKDLLSAPRHELQINSPRS